MTNMQDLEMTKKEKYSGHGFTLDGLIGLARDDVKPEVKRPKKVEPQNKKKNIVSNADILWHHDNKIQHFQKLQQSLPARRRELANTKDPKKRQTLEKTIADIESRKEEIEYMMATTDIINRYIEMTRNEDTSRLERDTTGAISKFIVKYDNVEKQKLTEEYYRVMNMDLKNSKNLRVGSDKCDSCNGQFVTRDGLMVCTDCGAVCQHSTADFQVSYRDLSETVLRTSFSYKKTNRLQEWLDNLQGKENTEIPQTVVDAILAEIKKESNVDLSTLDVLKIRYYLKRLNLTSYYDHIPNILYRINGKPPLRISPEVEERLLAMFKEIQEPFYIVVAKICPQRSSFLSYPFVLYKMCELLGLDEYLQYFPLLKSIDKLRTQDKIWKGICEMLDWEYIPSI